MKLSRSYMVNYHICFVCLLAKMSLNITLGLMVCLMFSCGNQTYYNFLPIYIMFFHGFMLMISICEILMVMLGYCLQVLDYLDWYILLLLCVPIEDWRGRLRRLCRAALGGDVCFFHSISSCSNKSWRYGHFGFSLFSSYTSCCWQRAAMGKGLEILFCLTYFVFHVYTANRLQFYWLDAPFVFVCLDWGGHGCVMCGRSTLISIKLLFRMHIHF
jgi:hypothetical protein